MNKFDEEFKDFFERGIVKKVYPVREDGKNLKTSIEDEADRWEDEHVIKTFRQAITENSYLFKNKIVLDLDCGFGFNSLFAAQAGAAKVYAVESSHCSEYSEEIIKKRGLSEVIEVIHGDVKNLPISPHSVDVIICDWVGSFIINDKIVERLIEARDKYLKSGGIVFPDSATYHISAINDIDYYQSRFRFWDNVYGFSMPAMKEMYYNEVCFDHIEKNMLLSDSQKLKTIDIQTLNPQDIGFLSDFKLSIKEKGQLNAFSIWIEIGFNCCHIPIKVSYGPLDPKSSYFPAIFYLKKPINVSPGDKLTGKLAVQKHVINEKSFVIGRLLYRIQDCPNISQFFKIIF